MPWWTKSWVGEMISFSAMGDTCNDFDLQVLLVRGTPRNDGICQDSFGYLFPLIARKKNIRKRSSGALYRRKEDDLEKGQWFSHSIDTQSSLPIGST